MGHSEIASCMEKRSDFAQFSFIRISLKQHLANIDKRAASKTRAERKMAAVREVAAMEGRSRARVTPSVSRGRASMQEETHSRRLRGRAVTGTQVRSQEYQTVLCLRHCSSYLW